MIKPATPYRAAKKVIKTAKAVGAGVKDYGQKHKAINAQASKEIMAKPSGSRVHDVQRVAKRMDEIKKEQGVSLRNSIRGKLGI